MLGKPVFKGTRLTVEHILRELGTGISQDELFDSSPTSSPNTSKRHSSTRPTSCRWTSAFRR
ncbi:MAG: DUF433 domain-containing protein [Isosphaerales bacterium]